MANPSPNQIKRNTIEGNIIEYLTNLFRLKREKHVFEDKIIRGIITLFESKGEDYYEPIRVGNIFSNIYTESESEGDENKTLSIEEYLNKFRPYLSDMINDLKN